MNTAVPQICAKCNLPIDGATRIYANVAPNAASGGTMLPHHPACAPFNLTPSLGTPCPTCATLRVRVGKLEEALLRLTVQAEMVDEAEFQGITASSFRRAITSARDLLRES